MKHSFLSLLVAIVATSTLLVASSSAAGRRDRHVTETILIPYGDLEEDSDTGEVNPVVRSLLAERQKLDYISWFFESFRPADQLGRESIQIEHVGKKDVGFLMYLMMTEGFIFESSRGTILYQEEECFLLECYTAHLSLIDDKGRTIWRRKSPFFGLPVHPFEVDGRLLFLGNRGPTTKLYSVNLTSGKTEGFSPSEDVPLEGFAPIRFPPFFKNGYVCASEEMVTELDVERNAVVVTNDPRTVLMKLARKPN